MNAQGKRVLVIGGETPVGRAVAVGLAGAGADVAMASLTKNAKAEFAINSALNEIWAIGRRGIALAIDASNVEEVRDAVARAEEELSGLDAVVAVGAAAVLLKALGDRPVIAVPDDASGAQALLGVLARISAE